MLAPKGLPRRLDLFLFHPVSAPLIDILPPVSPPMKRVLLVQSLPSDLFHEC